MNYIVEFGDCYRWDGNDLLINVQAQPKASKDEIAGVIAGYLKVRITAPPVDGKANQHLIKFLAKLFKLPKSRVLLEAGASARQKRFRIVDVFFLPDGFTRAGI